MGQESNQNLKTTQPTSGMTMQSTQNNIDMPYGTGFDYLPGGSSNIFTGNDTPTPGYYPPPEGTVIPSGFHWNYQTGQIEGDQPYSSVYDPWNQPPVDPGHTGGGYVYSPAHGGAVPVDIYNETYGGEETSGEAGLALDIPTPGSLDTYNPYPSGTAPGEMTTGQEGSGEGGSGGEEGTPSEYPMIFRPEYYLSPEQRAAYNALMSYGKPTLPTTLPPELEQQITRGVSEALGTELTRQQGIFQAAGMGGRVSSPRHKAMYTAAENIAEQLPGLMAQQLVPFQQTAIQAHTAGIGPLIAALGAGQWLKPDVLVEPGEYTAPGPSGSEQFSNIASGVAQIASLLMKL